MAQVGWVYLDDFGGRHRIGLYHGDRTGHVLLHCNMRVVQVDFSVKESRKYSFFIEDELCEVSVVKEKGGFTYDFQVNKKIDTPRNRLRKADDRRTWGQVALFLAAFVLVIAVAVFGFRHYAHSQREKIAANHSASLKLVAEQERHLAAQGRESIAELSLVGQGPTRQIQYSFIGDGSRQTSGFFAAPGTETALLPNGFPLSGRDAFVVRFLPSEPEVHRVDFSRPTAETIARYLQLAFEAEQRAHPEATPGRCFCLAKLVLEKKGWAQLADVIFQTTPPEQNGVHNRDAYLRLVRDAEFSKVISQGCWDK